MAITIKKYALFYHAMQFAIIAASIILILGCTAENDLSELNTYLRKSISWNCTTFEKKVPLKIYFIAESTDSASAPVIVYVKGLAAERVGQESDLAILSDYIEQRYIVVSIDYGGDERAVSPSIDKDLHAILGAIYGTRNNEESPLLGALRLEPTPARCFFLPAGYRLATDLVFWEFDKHGSYGTMKRVVQVYNEQVVDEKGRHHIPGRSLALSPDDLIDRDGAPLESKLSMDIIYPSQANKKVPLVFWISTTTVRAPSSSPGGYRPHLPCFPMRGYAYAIIDHCYNPVALHYGHFKGHSLANINGLKAYTAAIRFLRAHTDAYSIDSRYIGGWGHSKGAYALTRLSDPNNAAGAERQHPRDEPEGSPEPQPYAGYPSSIAAGYQSMGNGTRWSAQYVTEDYAPTIVACGEHDHFNHWLDWPRVVKAYEDADANHVALGMLGLGHELPYGFDDSLGVDRYELVMSFFDQYLKVEDKLAPVVLYTTPRDRQTDVAPSETISIQFAPVMDERSIVDGVKVISGDGSPVEGSWSKSRQGSRFEFTSKEDFRESEKYKMIISAHVKNKVGTQLGETRIAEFTIGKKAAETKIGTARLSPVVNGEVPPKGWVASPAIVRKFEARDKDKSFKVIYREENIPPYTLPDALVMNNGSKVTNAETWRNRRRLEILELFRTHVHGRAPIGRPGDMKFEPGSVNREALEGKATQKDLAVNFTGKSSGPRMDMRVYTPNGAAKPVPCFLYLGRPLTADSAPQMRWGEVLPEILSRGYALAVIDRGGIDPDEYDEFKNGVHGAFDPPGDRPADAWATISAWAWGLSRALDYLETDKDVDDRRVAVMGVSRAGKTALWAGAQDERFAMTISICSGCTGAALSRRRFGNPIDVLNSRNPHWYCENYKQYGGNEDALPIDQHMLLSLIAPRLLYVCSADEDLWADPRGEFLGAKHADPVYHLLGEMGLEAEHMPAVESPVQTGSIGYHIRTGGHGLEPYDWLRFLDFADKHWKNE